MAPGMLGPYRSVGEVSRMPNIPPDISGPARAILRRAQQDLPGGRDAPPSAATAAILRHPRPQQPRDVQVLSFYWSDPAIQGIEPARELASETVADILVSSSAAQHPGMTIRVRSRAINRPPASASGPQDSRPFKTCA